MNNDISKDPSTQNTIMFASTVPSIFDSVHNSLHQTIRSQVSTLPIIQSSSSCKQGQGQEQEESSCEEKIYKELSRVYANHMDVAQLYAENELFCLDKSLTKRKREQIVNAFLALEQEGADDDGASGSVSGNGTGTGIGTGTGSQPDDRSNNANHCKKQEEEEKEVKFRYNIPSNKEEIPSLEEMAAIKEEISALRQQLRQSTIEKQMLRQQIHVLDETKRSSTAIDDSISQIIGEREREGDEKILKSVEAANDGKKQLQDLTSTGQELIGQMDALSREKEGKNETEEFGEAMKARALEVGRALENKSRPKKRTLEEDYKERKEKFMVNGEVLKLFKKKWND